MTGTAYRIPVRTTPALELIGRIIAGTVKLDGALCRDHRPGLFDGLSAEDIATARAICAACPALAPCQQWADAQPRHKLTGVIGGRDTGRAVSRCLFCGTPLRRNRRWLQQALPGCRQATPPTHRNDIVKKPLLWKRFRVRQMAETCCAATQFVAESNGGKGCGGSPTHGMLRRPFLVANGPETVRLRPVYLSPNPKV